jgi:hypothetical protein
MTKTLALLGLTVLTFSTAHASAAQTLPEAFSQGAQFGTSGNTAARGGINAGSASTTVPGYATSAPAASYYGGPGLGAASAATLASCATNPQDAACQAVNFSQNNAGQRPSFTIDTTNPMLTRSKTITADPASIAGNLAGTYSACTTQTVTSPDIFANRTCNEYRQLEHNTCTRTLNVTVTDNGLSCNVGNYISDNPRIMLIRPIVWVGAVCAEDIRFLWTWGFSECNGYSGAIYNTSIMPGPEQQRLSVNLGCGGTYYIDGGCADGNCSYNVGRSVAICSRPCDDDCCAWEYPDVPLVQFNFKQPAHSYTFTDAWDNQCSAFEARLP